MIYIRNELLEITESSWVEFINDLITPISERKIDNRWMSI